MTAVAKSLTRVSKRVKNRKKVLTNEEFDAQLALAPLEDENLSRKELNVLQELDELEASVSSPKELYERLGAIPLEDIYR